MSLHRVKRNKYESHSQKTEWKVDLCKKLLLKNERHMITWRNEKLSFYIEISDVASCNRFDRIKH